MIDSSILARECVPEAPSVALTVHIRDLRIWTLEAVERSPAREPLIDRWARDHYREGPGRREKYGLTSATHELMTRGFSGGAFALRVHDGARAWRLPFQAFQGWRPDIDLEMTWTTGRLWQFDASDAFRPIAALELPLLTTEAEADTYRRGVLQEIAAIEAASPRPPSARRTMLEQQIEEAEAAAPAPDPETHSAWVAEWSAKARWPLREALLWVALLDIDEVAKAVLTSFWAGNEREGIAGPHLAKCDIEGQSGWRRVVERDPEPRMMQALRGGGLRASGLFEGAGPMAAIGAVQWENLTLGVAPKGQRGTSDAWQSAARINDQMNGIDWRGHWTGICIERQDLFAAFPQVPLAGTATQKATAAQRTACKAWLVAMMKASRACRTKPKAALLADARIKFGESLPARSFDTAWRLAIAEAGAPAWANAGRTRRTL